MNIINIFLHSHVLAFRTLYAAAVFRVVKVGDNVQNKTIYAAKKEEIF